MPDPHTLALPYLTPQEGRVLAFLLRGLTTKEIANAMHLSPRTVTGHETALREWFGARNRTELVARALTNRFASRS